MDGTGKLFSHLLPFLSEVDYQVLPLPEYGKQDYFSISQYISSKLPDTPYILIVESFSGPLITELIFAPSNPTGSTQNNAPKGIILAASFQTPPNKWLIKLARRLPLQIMVNLPGFQVLAKRFLLGRKSPTSIVETLKTTLLNMPGQLLAKRLHTLEHMRTPKGFSDIPTLSITPGSDWIISRKQYRELSTTFRNIEYKTVEGGHFILQGAPQACAELIIDFKNTLSNKGIVKNCSFVKKGNT